MSDETVYETTDLNICVLGHVDSGKSTTSGQIFFNCGGIDERTLKKLEQDAKDMNKGSFYLAHTFDTNKDEREKGITISSASKQMTTPNKKINLTLVDAPGHRNFIGNMTVGAVQCRAAVLIVSMVNTEFIAGVAPDGQTLEHVRIGVALGISKWIVAFNKMDEHSVNWSESLFNDKKGEVSKMLKKCGVKPNAVEYVPISSFSNYNILSNPKDKMKWYTGPSLIEHIESVGAASYDLTVGSRLAITGLHKISGVGEVVTGKLLTGKLSVGERVEVAPTPGEATVKSIEMFKTSRKVAYPMQNIGITLKAVDFEHKLKRGDVLGNKGSGLKNVKRFTALVILTGTNKLELAVGCIPVISCHTARVSAKIVKFEKIFDRKLGKDVKEERPYAKTGDVATIVFQPEQQLVIEADEKFMSMRNLVIRLSNATIGVGQCKSINNDQYEPNFVSETKKKLIEEKKASKKK